MQSWAFWYNYNKVTVCKKCILSTKVSCSILSTVSLPKSGLSLHNIHATSMGILILFLHDGLIAFFAGKGISIKNKWVFQSCLWLGKTCYSKNQIDNSIMHYQKNNNTHVIDWYLHVHVPACANNILPLTMSNKNKIFNIHYLIRKRLNPTGYYEN